MEFKTSNDSNELKPDDGAGEKKSQTSLLILLLILVGGFSYLYFFTDLIKPQVVKTASEAVAPVPQVVKMPLPQREGAAQAPAKTEPPSIAAAPPAAAPTGAKAATAPASAKPADEAKKSAVVKPVDKKASPVAVAGNKAGAPTVAKTSEKKSPPDVKKSGAAPAKSVAAQNNVKKQASGAPVPVKKVATAWTIVIGNYLLEETLSGDMVRVRKAGFDPVVKASIKKKTTMNRLLVARLHDKGAALAQLEKLKQLTSDAFMIEQGGGYSVFAGSYIKDEAARSERDRLKAAGYSVSLKRTDIAIPSQSLSVGPFANKKSADAALGKLKKAGIKATLSQQ
ncbi:MAG: SPOR domain-containing protein [Desulfuromonadaceae bacterium]|nr:SPOR domain-containing protein [Desulfuromonadaceae bacterium]MDD5107387.1 SPOR domain-containing protein [Desulfuromonadaceae bacterium]